ncbi:MAG: hypothetical protein JWO89_1703, partial [Verrucomicrobiaceae bacterium]|nr:hypothetical protein [Verrucomicrobiaceae bacterium]
VIYGRTIKGIHGCAGFSGEGNMKSIAGYDDAIGPVLDGELVPTAGLTEADGGHIVPHPDIPQRR